MREHDSVLIKALLDPEVYDHKVEDIELVETHISWVILTGSYAYKIKKAVNFGFLDFSTLERRHFYCQEELRLNKRLAPQIYLDVVHITGEAENPVINGDGLIIEYAVKMRQFPQSAQFDRLLMAGKLSHKNMINLAEVVAAFHGASLLAGEQSDYGSVSSIKTSVMENFRQIDMKEIRHQDRLLLEELKIWSDRFVDKHRGDFVLRKQQHAIRECHGDMHLRNIALIDGRSVLFDCLEFNDELRWIDVMSELAFICMDLEYRGRIDLSQVLLNCYLEITGDYQGLDLLKFYKVYRALVRAKVAFLRLRQGDIDEQQRQQLYNEFSAYLKLAKVVTDAVTPTMYITHGLSGSGKTTGTASLLEQGGVIRIRSDVERKRILGSAVNVVSSKGDGLSSGIYSVETGVKTYHYLYELADSILAAGYSVVVDACFLKYVARRQFHLLADTRSVPFVILSFVAPVALLKERLVQRQRYAGDASDADVRVLADQLNGDYKLLDYEKNYCYIIRQGIDENMNSLKDVLNQQQRYYLAH